MSSGILGVVSNLIQDALIRSILRTELAIKPCEVIKPIMRLCGRQEGL